MIVSSADASAYMKFHVSRCHKLSVGKIEEYFEIKVVAKPSPPVGKVPAKPRESMKSCSQAMPSGSKPAPPQPSNHQTSRPGQPSSQTPTSAFPISSMKTIPPFELPPATKFTQTSFVPVELFENANLSNVPQMRGSTNCCLSRALSLNPLRVAGICCEAGSRVSVSRVFRTRRAHLRVPHPHISQSQDFMRSRPDLGVEMCVLCLRRVLNDMERPSVFHGRRSNWKSTFTLGNPKDIQCDVSTLNGAHLPESQIKNYLKIEATVFTSYSSSAEGNRSCTVCSNERSTWMFHPLNSIAAKLPTSFQR
ncbi:unnamed protein product, partial [Nesidiocoris tenuis]